MRPSGDTKMNTTQSQLARSSQCGTVEESRADNYNTRKNNHGGGGREGGPGSTVSSPMPLFLAAWSRVQPLPSLSTLTP